LHSALVPSLSHSHSRLVQFSEQAGAETGVLLLAFPGESLPLINQLANCAIALALCRPMVRNSKLFTFYSVHKLFSQSCEKIVSKMAAGMQNMSRYQYSNKNKYLYRGIFVTGYIGVIGIAAVT